METKLYVSDKVVGKAELMEKVIYDFTHHGLDGNGYQFSVDDMRNVNVVALDEDFEEVSSFNEVMSLED